MNAATLTRIRVLSGTTEELIELIKVGSKQQRLPGLVESALYHVPDKPAEIFVLSVWENLNVIPNIEENYARWQNREIVARSQLVSCYTYRLIKEYRTVSATIGASYLRLVTLPGSHSQEWIDLAVTTLAQVRASGIGTGHIGSWLGQRVDVKQGENTFSILARHDWRSLEAQQAFQRNQLTREVRASTQALGAEVEFASLDLAGLVMLELDEEVIKSKEGA